MVYERIRNLREDKDLSQEQLCKYLNCKQRTYSDYERGKLDIPTPLLFALADFHQTSIDYLLGRTDQKTPYPPPKKRS
ncbi:XRE family transcriptional regulator [Paenibacillus ginsengarvi]|uniref:XRE family transcriptional regulator n=1 Tax=Paenibacillus ginsengarvi TaxID=400777 RepID=A0A3B0BDZ5_9BACL|nr:helix-turn-helix transcriptional regulator [Paenibacillus ginsengarvi]RKN70651.1 XRE family transcriptional regulator [Paenibacillus ginsengarvi]